MKVEPSGVETGLDRQATSEEIRMAISLLPDYHFEVDKDAFLEICSDRGGYVHVNLEEEVLELIEGVDGTIH